MKKANVAELKNRLSYYLTQVKNGETVLVMERATPIARLVPAAPPASMTRDESAAWLKRMEANGVLRIGAHKGVAGITSNPPAKSKPVGAVETLIEDRRRR